MRQSSSHEPCHRFGTSRRVTICRVGLESGLETKFLPGALFDFYHLTARERVQLAKELWESLADQEEARPLTSAQAEELDRRLAAYQLDRDLGLPWAEEALRALEDDSEA